MAKASLVFIPFYGLSHFTTMIAFAKNIQETTNNAFSITILIVNPSPSLSTSCLIDSTSLDVQIQVLWPSVELPPIRSPKDITDRVIESHQKIKTAISTILSSGTSVNAVVFDLFGTSIMDVTKELNVPAYVFFPTNAFMLGLMLHLKTLHEKFSVDFEDMNDDIEIPGLGSIPPSSMPTPVMRRNEPSYSFFVEHGHRFLDAKGIIVNTFVELEQKTLEAIQEGHVVQQTRPIPPLYPVGPVLALQNDNNAIGEEYFEWLNEQPPNSVVFLCFGSMFPLSVQVMEQMAIGLEKSGVQFLWSMRSSATANTSLEELLPHGFIERTKHRGIVFQGWVSQKDILAHSAVGAFVTHCGWNSVTESLWFGVPMISWPLYAEQHLNAWKLVKDFGLAVELKMDRKRGNFVEAEEFEKGLRCLIEDTEKGRIVRNKVEEMKIACRKAVEKGGSSDVTFKSLIGEFSRDGSSD